MPDPMADWPEVTMADVFADQQFFANHPERRYFRRSCPDGIWLVRRRERATFLRTFTRTPPTVPDTDEALRSLWFETAWPELNPVERDALVREARKMERAASKQRRRQMRHPVT